MKIRYNAPVILTFSLIAVAIQLFNDNVYPGFSEYYFLVGPSMSVTDYLDYFRLFSHVLGHANWEHLLSNLTFILLLGPILEEKYGGLNMFIMILTTALVIGLINVAFFDTGLFGASGIVFMLITLVSIVDIEEGAIPLTYVLVVSIFIGKELLDIVNYDEISQMAHIVGGVLGALFGFVLAEDNARKAPRSYQSSISKSLKSNSKSNDKSNNRSNRLNKSYGKQR